MTESPSTIGPDEKPSSETDGHELNKSGPVVVVVTRRVKAGCEAAFEALLKGLHEAAIPFPGFLGLRSVAEKGEKFSEYTVAFSFDSEPHLRGWVRSNERQEWLDRMAGVIVEETPHRILTGLETWFTLPAGDSMPPPPRRKMVIVTWLGALPLVIGVQYALQAWAPPMPLWLRATVAVSVLIPMMTYVVMPRVTRLFCGWLYPATRSQGESGQSLTPSR